MSYITIIIPVYNSDKYLRKCLDSVLNQTLKEIEVIAVNDGSTDMSLNILEEYQNRDARLRIIDQANCGVASARNKAIKLVQSEFIAFVDSDDTLEPNTLESVYKKAKETDSDICLFGYVRIRENGTRVRNFLPPEDLYIGQSGIQNLLLNKFSSIACDKIFKTSLIHENKIEFPVDTYYEDSFFVLQAMTHANKSVTVEKPYYKWLIRGTSRSNSVSGKHIKNMFEILRKSKHYLEINDLYSDVSNEFEIRYLWHSANIIGNKVLLIDDIKLRTILAVIFMREVNKDNILSEETVGKIRSSDAIPTEILHIYDEIVETASQENLYELFELYNKQSTGALIHKLKRKYRSIKKRMKDKL